ncbi:MAG: GAF domain-containing protein [Sphingomonas sp.]
MTQREEEARRGLLAHSIDLLASAPGPDAAIRILARNARSIAGSEGITIVRMEGDQVHYVDENAITPMWKGRSFLAKRCVTGIAILTGQILQIPDIRADPRVPLDLYAALYVASLAVFPIGEVAAIGVYWGTTGPIDPLAVELMTELAKAAERAFMVPPEMLVMAEAG